MYVVTGTASDVYMCATCLLLYQEKLLEQLLMDETVQRIKAEQV
jgi:hypothetical protein